MKNNYHNDFDEVAEITDFSNFRPLAEVMPPEFVKMALEHTKNRKAVRGKQKAPTKSAITLRLDQDIIDFFKTNGKGYQTRINQVLLDYVTNHQALSSV